MNKKKRKAIKNTFLRTLICVDLISMVLMVVAIESINPKVPTIVLIIDALFLLVMAWANDWFEVGDEDGC